MAGLILKLRPHEQVMINGVMVENGERKTKIRVCTEGANILRMRDALRPEDATTPLKRAYYAAQMAVAGELTPPQAQILIEQALAGYGGVGGDDNTRNEAVALAAAGDFYKAMRTIREAPEPVLAPARQHEPRHRDTRERAGTAAT